MITSKRHDDGFSLIELLVAMALFSFLLLIVSSGFIGVVRTYQAGVSQRLVQQNSRLIIDDITRTVRIAQKVQVAPGNVSVTLGGVPGSLKQDIVCLNTSTGIIVYAVERVAQGRLRQGIYPVSTPCAYPSAGTIATWRTLGDVSVMVGKFSVTSTASQGASQQTASIGLSTASIFSQSLLVPVTSTSDFACKPQAGSQYCSVSHFIGTVQLRGGQ